MSRDMSAEPINHRVSVLKVDDSLGIVFGWAIVCAESGEPYYDTQGSYIDEDVMLKCAADFAKQADRPSFEEHERPDAGQVVFMFPMTADIAKTYGMETPKTGLMIGVMPDAEMLAKFRSGELTGFSIAGHGVKEYDV